MEYWNCSKSLWNCSTHYGRGKSLNPHASNIRPQMFANRVAAAAHRLRPRATDARARAAWRAAKPSLNPGPSAEKTHFSPGPPSRTHGALLTSILGFTRTVSHHPARHSLFLRRPDDTPAYACNKRSPHGDGHAVTVSLSPWCARARALNPTLVCLARVSPPRGACAHSRPQPAQPSPRKVRLRRRPKRIGGSSMATLVFGSRAARRMRCRQDAAAPFAPNLLLGSNRSFFGAARAAAARRLDLGSAL